MISDTNYIKINWTRDTNIGYLIEIILRMTKMQFCFLSITS